MRPDTRTKSNVATDIRDSIESLCTPPATYAKFLARLWPVFKKILEGKPDFSPTSFEQILRNQILEIIHRLQHAPTEVEPYALDMVDTLMETVLGRPHATRDLATLRHQVLDHVQREGAAGVKEDGLLTEATALLLSSPSFQWKG